LIHSFASYRLKPKDLIAKRADGLDCASNMSEVVPSYAIADWQSRNHPGFVYAFISSFRKAPLFDQTETWKKVRRCINEKTLGEDSASGTSYKDNGQVCVVIGDEDVVIKHREVLPSIFQCLDEKNVRVKIIDKAGHDIAIKKGKEVANFMADFMGL